MPIIKTTKIPLTESNTLATGDTSSFTGADVSSYYTTGLYFDYTIGAGATGQIWIKIYKCFDSSYTTNEKYHVMSLYLNPAELEVNFDLPVPVTRNLAFKVINDTDSSITYNISLVGARFS